MKTMNSCSWDWPGVAERTLVRSLAHLSVLSAAQCSFGTRGALMFSKITGMQAMPEHVREREVMMSTSGDNVFVCVCEWYITIMFHLIPYLKHITKLT